MRKVFILILVLMSLPAAMAEENDSFYYGTWVCTSELGNKDFVMSALHLFPDHTAYFIRDIVDSEKETNRNNMLTFKWKSDENGVSFALGTNYNIHLDLLSSCYLGEKTETGEYLYYSKVYNIYDVRGNGFTLHSGIYTVGEDLPAGSWRIEYAGTSTGEVALYENMSAYENRVFSLFDQLLGQYAGQFIIGKLPVKDGNVLFIEGDMFFMPYQSIFP